MNLRYSRKTRLVSLKGLMRRNREQLGHSPPVDTMTVYAVVLPLLVAFHWGSARLEDEHDNYPPVHLPAG
jgi:hypothetical protein